MTDEQNKISEYPFGVEPLGVASPATAVTDATEEAEGTYMPKVFTPAEPMKLAEPVEMRKWTVRLADAGGDIEYKAHEFALTEEGEAVFVVRTGPETEYLAGSVARGQWRFVRPS